jgi:hypothetical protein
VRHPGVDLWWSGKHDNPCGNIQVITVPDGWPIWTSQVRPSREHDTNAVRTHTEILHTLGAAGDALRTLGYEGESDTITVAFKKPNGGRLTLVQQQLNTAERGNSLLNMTFKVMSASTLSDRRRSERRRRPAGGIPVGVATLCEIPDNDVYHVRAAFHYVRTNETVEPARLLDAFGLRELIAG